MLFDAVDKNQPEKALELCRQFVTSKALLLAKQPANEHKLFSLANEITRMERALFNDNRQVANTDYPPRVVVQERIVEREVPAPVLATPMVSRYQQPLDLAVSIPVSK